MSLRGRATSAHDDAMSSRDGATSGVIRATSRAINAMSESSDVMSERVDATSEFSAAMIRLEGAMKGCGASIATNGGATGALCLSIERKARAIAIKALAIERLGPPAGTYLFVNEGVNPPKLRRPKYTTVSPTAECLPTCNQTYRTGRRSPNVSKTTCGGISDHPQLLPPRLRDSLG